MIAVLRLLVPFVMLAMGVAAFALMIAGQWLFALAASCVAVGLWIYGGERIKVLEAMRDGSRDEG
jgi:hypothetical protein